MNVGKLKRVAIKEFKRSPAKTGFLLAMLPVAMYFCVPLLYGAVKKSAPDAGDGAAAVIPQSADFVLPAAAKPVAKPGRVEQGWIEVALALENDKLALAEIIPRDARNPFSARGKQNTGESNAPVSDDEQFANAETEHELAETENPNVVAPNPIRDLGLALSATMVGPRSRFATINGKTYKQGATIPVPIDTGLDAADAITIPVEVSYVDQRYVDLKMDGHEFRLQLPNEKTKDAIVVKSRSN